jgi:predicted DCC family thiol-disulfide oxidoreductase YuxK
MAHRPILLYDGHCSFCVDMVRRLEAWDQGGALETVPAASERGRQVVASRALSVNLAATVVLVNEDEVLVRSEAALEALRLTGGWRRILARLGRWVPRRWRDRVYDLVARNRSRLGGGLITLDEKGRGQDSRPTHGP